MKITTLTYSEEHHFSETLPTINSDQLMIMLFGGSEFIDLKAPFATLKQHYPHAHFMGCSSAGEILNQTIHDNSLVIALVEFNHTTLQSVTRNIDTPQQSYEVGTELATQLKTNNNDLKGIIVLSDGININGSELTRGLGHIAASSDISITGGLAGDGTRFEQTWVLANGEPQRNAVTAIGLYGDITIRHGSGGGWIPFGPTREITRSENNILYELDGKPALELYKSYLGELASDLPASGLRFPLKIRRKGEEQALVRTILAVDEAKQSLTFAGDVPLGASAQLMRANTDQLLEGAEDAALMSKTNNTDDVLSIAISCVGRRLVMGADTEEELDTVMDVLPPSTKQIGFYSYGEISPGSSGTCDLHNQTMTLATFHE